MPTFDETIFAAVKTALASSLQNLLHLAGTQDHEAVTWATFSDDDCTTRIIFSAYRQDALRVLSLLTEAEVRAGLDAARAAGKSKVFWGLEAGATA